MKRSVLKTSGERTRRSDFIKRLMALDPEERQHAMFDHTKPGNSDYNQQIVAVRLVQRMKTTIENACVKRDRESIRQFQETIGKKTLPVL